jgi:8-oxo-dGTP pyrophosphatase MutT (NUDIX family)
MADQERRGPWTIRNTRQVYDNPWIGVAEHDVIRPDGSPGLYGVCGMKGIAVGVVPIDTDGSTWLVGQHRFPRDYYSWELPEGGGDPALPPIESAKRELREETGITAQGWQELLQLDFSNAVTDEIGFGFLAWDLDAGATDPDEGEVLEIRRLPFRAALEMVMSGEIRDAFTQVMLLKVDALGRRGELPDQVAGALGYARQDV